MSADQIWSALLGPLGTLVLALLVIGAFLRGWIVPGYLYRSVAKERDRLFEIAVPMAHGIEQGASALKEQSRHVGLSE